MNSYDSRVGDRPLQNYVLRLDQVGMDDVENVGGKNASLGEMLQELAGANVKVPNGFATTALAYKDFLTYGGLEDQIKDKLEQLDTNNIQDLKEAGKTIRALIMGAEFQPQLNSAIEAAWAEMSNGEDIAVAVRSSATAEDLPDASFAGQQETFLNVRGLEDIKASIKEVFASLYNDRAISYRVHHGFEHSEVALSAGVQRMVRSETGASGVMFTLDTESGFNHVVFITAAYGLGETVVQGAVNPDEFYVYKPTLKMGAPAIIRRTIGSKAIKMVYSEPGSENPVSTVQVSPEERCSFFC